MDQRADRRAVRPRRPGDKVAALDAGADDYVSKPFDMEELLARLRAALRRGASATTEAADRSTRPDFTVDLGAKRVVTAGGEIRLTPTEWHLVETLVRNAGRLVTARQLLAEVWGPQYTDESGYIRVHLAHVRRKLEPDPSQPRATSSPSRAWATGSSRAPADVGRPLRTDRATPSRASKVAMNTWPAIPSTTAIRRPKSVTAV